MTDAEIFEEIELTLLAEQSNCCQIISQLYKLAKSEDQTVKRLAQAKLEELRKSDDLLLSTAVNFLDPATRHSANPEPVALLEVKREAPPSYDEAQVSPEYKPENNPPPYEIACFVLDDLQNNNITLTTMFQLRELAPNSKQAEKELERLRTEGDLLIQAELIHVIYPVELERFESINARFLNEIFISVEDLCVIFLNRKQINNPFLILLCLCQLYEKIKGKPEIHSAINSFLVHDNLVLRYLASLTLGLLQDANSEPAANVARQLKVFLENKNFFGDGLYEFIDNLAALNMEPEKVFSILDVLLNYYTNARIATCYLETFKALCAFYGWNILTPNKLIKGRIDLIETTYLLKCSLWGDSFLRLADEMVGRIFNPDDESNLQKLLRKLKLIECYRRFNLPSVDKKAADMLTEVIQLAQTSKNKSLRKHIAILRDWSRLKNVANKMQADDPLRLEQKQEFTAEEYYFGLHNGTHIPDLLLAEKKLIHEIENELKDGRIENTETKIEKLCNLSSILYTPDEKNIDERNETYRKRLEKFQFEKLLSKFKQGDRDAEKQLYEFIQDRDVIYAFYLGNFYQKNDLESKAVDCFEIGTKGYISPLFREPSSPKEIEEAKLYEEALLNLRIYASRKPGNCVLLHCIKAAEIISPSPIGKSNEHVARFVIQELKSQVPLLQRTYEKLYQTFQYCNNILYWAKSGFSKQVKKILVNNWVQPVTDDQIMQRLKEIEKFKDNLEKTLQIEKPKVLAVNVSPDAAAGLQHHPHPAHAYNHRPGERPVLSNSLYDLGKPLHLSLKKL